MFGRSCESVKIIADVSDRLVILKLTPQGQCRSRGQTHDWNSIRDERSHLC